MLVGIDIGATSIKAGAYDDRGACLARATRANLPVPQEDGVGWLTWDAPRIWRDVAEAVREVVTAAPSGDPVRGVAVTGFGADGAPFSVAKGEQRYPVISWHDTRAEEQAREIEALVGARRIYEITGYHVYPINTLNRWRWLLKHAPETLDGARWLMVPDIVVFRLCGEMRTDPTLASTTMAYDLAANAWSRDLLDAAGVPTALLAPLAEPGETVGHVTAAASRATGLPVGTPVVAAGHDCEVGAFAAFAGLPAGTLIDITGTWEMLLVELGRFQPQDALFEHGIDWERSLRPGGYLCQSLMPAGSVLSWLRDRLFGDDDEPWDALVDEAAAVGVGAGGVMLLPAFVAGMGPFSGQGVSGAVLGLRTTTTRGQLARAGFEALCLQLRGQVELLERASGARCEALRVIGGAQRNDLWLQLKADVTGRRVEALGIDEPTLLGAALIAGVGGGVFSSLDDAQRAVDLAVRSFEPDPHRQSRYADLYERAFCGLPKAAAAASRVLAEVR